MQLSSTPEYLPQCQFVLDHSKYAYAQLVAANALKKLLVQSWNHLTPSQQLDFRNYTLSYLAQRGTSIEPFVSSNLVQIVATVTKLGWSSGEEHKAIVQEVSKFLHATTGHLVLGLQASPHAPSRRAAPRVAGAAPDPPPPPPPPQLLQQLVAEMNMAGNTRSLTQQRKVSASFRDTALFQILQIGLRTLQQLSTGAAPGRSHRGSAVPLSPLFGYLVWQAPSPALATRSPASESSRSRSACRASASTSSGPRSTRRPRRWAPSRRPPTDPTPPAFRAGSRPTAPQPPPPPPSPFSLLLSPCAAGSVLVALGDGGGGDDAALLRHLRRLLRAHLLQGARGARPPCLSAPLPLLVRRRAAGELRPEMRPRCGPRCSRDAA